MKKEKNESYGHWCAKMIFLDWLRAAAKEAKNEYARLGKIEWAVNRGAPTYGVFEEYPIIAGMCQPWDEHNEWGKTETWPDYAWMKENYRGAFKIPDLAITHKGVVSYVIEIVHKNDLSDDKFNFYCDLPIRPEVVVIPCQWVLGQFERPSGIPSEFFIL